MKAAILPLLFLFFATALFAQPAKPTLAPLPAWVTTRAIDYNNSQLIDEAEGGVLDLAYERQVNLAANTSFHKKAIKILSETGVQNNAQVEIEFDPEYQRLALHSLQVIRNGSSINKLQLSKVKMMQQEKDMDRFLYNGSLTAMIILDDIRTGDVIEYAYSVVGRNPVFGNKYAGVFDLQYAVPVNQLYYKIIVPKGRSLQIKNNGSQVKPTVTSTAEQITYEWSLQQITALKIPGSLPSWYDPYPVIRISEYKSWKEIVDWAMNLYTVNQSAAPQVQAFVAQLKKQHATPEARVTAALRFVQDDIRYMGIELGAGSHKPHHPEQVFTQRYGDCKDKSFLLCTLLRSMGIAASPVLINTEYKKSISDWLPSPFAFDHVTVQVSLNGKTYYFDPTSAYQRGSIDQISFPDYQIGLVVHPQSQSLTAIPLQEKGKVQVQESFFVKNMAGTSTLTATSKYSGSFADNVRSRFKSESLSEIKKSYLEFYQAYFKNISDAELSYEDDAATGTFTTTETYQIKEIWGDNSNFKNASFEPFVINGLMRRPDEQQRKYPLSISYPNRYEEEITIHLPEDWDIKKQSFHTDDPAFRFTNTYHCTGRKVKLHYTYEALQDHVEPEAYGKYKAAIKHADENIAYSLSQSFVEDSVAGTTSGGFTSMYLVLGLCVVITFLLKGRRG